MAGNLGLREPLILLLLNALKRRGLTPIREYELHQLVRHAQTNISNPFSYLDQPISYSYELESYLRALERAHYLHESIIVRDGWVPRFEYDLDDLGQAEAEDQRARMEIEQPSFVRRLEEQSELFALTCQPHAAISPH